MEQDNNPPILPPARVVVEKGLNFMALMLIKKIAPDSVLVL